MYVCMSVVCLSLAPTCSASASEPAHTWRIRPNKRKKKKKKTPPFTIEPFFLVCRFVRGHICYQTPAITMVTSFCFKFTENSAASLHNPLLRAFGTHLIVKPKACSLTNQLLICSDRTSQKTPYVTATKPNRLVLFREIIAVYCENDMEPINKISLGETQSFYN
jgi:hypothetical protein